MSRLRDPDAGTVKLMNERACRICGSNDTLARHHLIPRGHQGDDVDDNLIPLCLRCHDDLHLRRGDVRPRLLQSLTLQERTYCEARMGTNWLASYYGER